MSSVQRPAAFIASPYATTPGFGTHHPLAIPRVSTVIELCARLGWLDPNERHTSAPASAKTLAEFHAPEYVAALQHADACGQVTADVRERFRIGTSENPLFPGVYTRAASAVGGSILAAELAMQGVVSFHPEGGTHHGRPDRASGFCYFNDPVFALRVLVARGLRRILYVDLDAHHGDGVQDAMRDEPAVHTVSIHEAGRWPFTGAANDCGGGRARNFPVPSGFHDAELDYVMRHGVLAYAAALVPQAVVITCGTDALAGDPLSGLSLTNGALWRAVEALVARSPVAVVLGGGGYNPWTLARCWAGLWARLSGRTVPRELPASARDLLAGLACDLVDDEDVRPDWLSTIEDASSTGGVRASVQQLVAVHQEPPAAAAGGVCA